MNFKISTTLWETLSNEERKQLEKDLAKRWYEGDGKNLSDEEWLKILKISERHSG